MSYSVNPRFIESEEMDDNAPLLESRVPSHADSKDPYYKVKKELDLQLERLVNSYNTYKKLYPVVDTSTHGEFISLRKSLGKECKSVQNIITGLKGAVDQVERNRRKFKSIQDSELHGRKQYVVKVQQMLSDVKHGYDSPDVRDKMAHDSRLRNQAGGRHARQSLQGHSALESESEVDPRAEAQVEMKTMIARQDDQLEHLGVAVERLGSMAGSINEELKEQNQMLKGLDEDLDDASNKMNTVMSTLSKHLRTKDSCQIYTVIVMLLVTILLFFLVLYT